MKLGEQTRVEIRVFGVLEFVSEHRSLFEFKLTKTYEVLGFLAVHPGQKFMRQELCMKIWPTVSKQQAQNYLSLALHYARLDFCSAGLDLESWFLITRKVVALQSLATPNDWVSFWTTYHRLLSDPHYDSVVQFQQQHRGNLLCGLNSEWVQGKRDEIASALTTIGELKSRNLARAEGFEPPTPSSEDW